MGSSSSAAVNANVGNDAANLSSSSSISANAKAGIDEINKGYVEVNFYEKYVDIIILLLFEKKK
jgi:hypothetical protein